jgi:4'-phosphopantetheinyl transferase
VRREITEVAVYRIRIPPAGSEPHRLEESLTREEIARIDRYATPARRQQARVAWRARREILATLLGLEPRDLPPSSPTADLLAELGSVPVFESLSHSGEWTLYAVSRGAPVGVDIERATPEIDPDRTAARFFTPEEAAALAALPARSKREAFFRVWTRKEAYLKARGGGVPSRLRAVVVSTGETAAVLFDRNDRDVASHWTLRDLDAPDGYAAALAVQGRIGRIQVIEWRLDGEPASA